jgi:hypothetical protein
MLRRRSLLLADWRSARLGRRSRRRRGPGPGRLLQRPRTAPVGRCRPDDSPSSPLQYIHRDGRTTAEPMDAEVRTAQRAGIGRQGHASSVFAGMSVPKLARTGHCVGRFPAATNPHMASASRGVFQHAVIGACPNPSTRSAGFPMRGPADTGSHRLDSRQCGQGTLFPQRLPGSLAGRPLGPSSHVCAQHPSKPGHRVTFLSKNVTQAADGVLRPLV